MKYIIGAVLLIASIFSGYSYLTQSDGVGGGLGTIEQLGLWFFDGTNITQNLSRTPIKLTGYESSGNCLVTNETGVVSTSTCGGGGSSKWTDNGTTITPTTGESIIVSGTSTLQNVILSVLQASTSAGLIVRSNNGTQIADLGAGGGSNATFYGGVSIDGQTRLATSLTGLLEATSGVVATATPGVDYVATTSGDWTGTLDGIDGGSFLRSDTSDSYGGGTLTFIAGSILDLDNATTSSFLATNQNGNVIATTSPRDRSTHFGTQLASTISDFTTAVRTLISDTVTGLTYTSGTGVLSLDPGYEISLTASTSNWQSFYLTPSSRITAGNHIDWTSNTLDVITTGDWTGTFDGQEGSFYLSRANHTGTQSSTTITGLGSLAGLSTVNPINMAAVDFGSFTCNGTSCTVDSAAISNAMLANSSVSYGGVTLSLGGTDATPAFNLADATGLPISTGVSGLGTGVATFLATPSSANLDTAVTDDTGSGALVFGTSPSLTSPTLTSFFGTPCTGNQFLQDISDTGAFTCVTAAGGSSGLSTSTPWTNGNLAFVTSPGAVSSVATTTLVAGTGISFTGGTPVIVGSSPVTIESIGGGGGGSLSTTTDLVGVGAVSTVSYVLDDVMFGGSSSTTAEFQFDKDGANLIISSTTVQASTTIANLNSSQALDFGTATITATSTTMLAGFNINFKSAGKAIWSSLGSVSEFMFGLPSFTVASSSALNSNLFNAFATTSSSTILTHESSLGYFQDAGTVMNVGHRGYAGLNDAIDEFVVSGRFRQNGWATQDCDTIGAPAALSADVTLGCGYTFYEDNVATLTLTAGNGFAFGRLSTSAALDGMGVFAMAPSTGTWTFGTSTPSFEAYARLQNVTNYGTSTRVYIGYTNVTVAGTTYEVEPTAGCYFMASTTVANWQAICRTSAAVETRVDTGIATTTNPATGNFYMFRVDADTNGTRFFIRTSETTALKQVAYINTNRPTTAMNAGAHLGRVSGTTAVGLDVMNFNLQYRKFIPTL